MYNNLKYGKDFIEELSSLPQKSKANVVEVFSYSIILSCIVDKIWLSDTNLLKLKCKVIYLLMDVDLYFLQIIEEGLCTFFYHREVCLVSTNVIEDDCSFQGFVVDLFWESSLAVKHLHRRFGWAHCKPLLTFFLETNKKRWDAFSPGSHQAMVFLFF